MKQTLIDLFTSKKFLATLTALVVYVAGRFGLNIDPARLDPVWQILLVYVGAQGVADLGKSSAKVTAAADAAARTVGVLALVMLVASCGAVTGAAGHAAKPGIINCTAEDLGTTPALNLETLVAIANTIAAERASCMTPGGLDWKCVERDAIAKGLTLGGCMLAEMVAAAANAVKSSGSGLVADPAPPPGRAELERFRAQVAGGATYHTASGDL